MKYNHYGPGYGPLMEDPLIEEYRKRIDSQFEITESLITLEERKDIEQTLEKSLDNGKSFYSNAPEYIRRRMREYQKMVEEDVCF